MIYAYISFPLGCYTRDWYCTKPKSALTWAANRLRQILYQQRPKTWSLNSIKLIFQMSSLDLMWESMYSTTWSYNITRANSGTVMEHLSCAGTQFTTVGRQCLCAKQVPLLLVIMFGWKKLFSQSIQCTFNQSLKWTKGSFELQLVTVDIARALWKILPEFSEVLIAIFIFLTNSIDTSFLKFVFSCLLIKF